VAAEVMDMETFVRGLDRGDARLRDAGADLDAAARAMEGLDAGLTGLDQAARGLPPLARRALASAEGLSRSLDALAVMASELESALRDQGAPTQHPKKDLPT